MLAVRKNAQWRIWTVSDGTDYDGKPPPVVIVQSKCRCPRKITSISLGEIPSPPGIGSTLLFGHLRRFKHRPQGVEISCAKYWSRDFLIVASDAIKNVFVGVSMRYASVGASMYPGRVCGSRRPSTSCPVGDRIRTCDICPKNRCERVWNQADGMTRSNCSSS
jgi:hypothetical protein